MPEKMAKVRHTAINTEVAAAFGSGGAEGAGFVSIRVCWQKDPVGEGKALSRELDKADRQVPISGAQQQGSTTRSKRRWKQT